MAEDAEQMRKMFLEFLQLEKNYSPYTVSCYEEDVASFNMFMSEQSIKRYEDVQYPDVRLYLTKLFEEKFSRKSVARKISSLRSFYKFLLREKMVTSNPFSQVSIPKAEKRLPDFFYEEELAVLFKECEKDTPIGLRNWAALELLYATGIRISECCSIELKDIDFDLSTILIHGKGNKERYVLFGSFAHEALDRYIQYGRSEIIKKYNKNHGHLFVNFRGDPITPRGMRYILNQMIEKSALIGKIHPHKLRHSFATHLLNNGADMRTVQELLGHANLSSTQIYAHVTNEYLKRTYMNHHPRA